MSMRSTKTIILLSIFVGVTAFGVFLFFERGGAVHVPGTNINTTSTESNAWNESIGWLDFHNTSSVLVSAQKIAGYASSTSGDISLDCATTRIGNICGTSDYKVVNDGLGNLSGWGWNDNVGWVSFCGTTDQASSTSDCPNTSSTYRVLIDTNTGVFNQWGWNDLTGWISFNCTDPPADCGQSYKVVTTWNATSVLATLDSTIYDTEVLTGAQLNSVLWHGNLPSGASVRFKFAVSNSSSGPWNYLGPAGSTADSDYYGPVSPTTSKNLDPRWHSGRYFRYRIILISSQDQRSTPRVDEVILNWSP